ncbi:hypothetical protein ACRAWD_20085 [Caulobacter segnis]
MFNVLGAGSAFMAGFLRGWPQRTRRDLLRVDVTCRGNWRRLAPRLHAGHADLGGSWWPFCPARNARSACARRRAERIRLGQHPRPRASDELTVLAVDSPAAAVPGPDRRDRWRP